MGREVSAAADCIRDRKGVKVDRLILHAMDGTFNGTISWFHTPGRSPPTAAHYLFSRSGEVVQMVQDDKKAIHAGSTIEANWNERSIGFEHEVMESPWQGTARFPLNEWPDAMLTTSAKCAAAICKKFSIPVDRTHIVGHCEVPHRPTDSFHTDPGASFPWADYMARVAHELALLG